MTTSIERAGEEASFGPELFAFLADLREHNDREWFAANKERYEAHVLEPALAFIEDFGYRLQEISPHFVADPRRSGGSLFRIHRDTRFSKDKSPYKTNTGMHFRHERAKDALTAIRDAIVRDPDGWRSASELGDGLELGGESLKRVPSGYDKQHPLAEDLKRKDFFARIELSQDAATAPGFLDDYTRLCASAAPLMRFLCGALAVAY
jgi:uncharacterized protein (DUF2461 family)